MRVKYKGYTYKGWSLGDKVRFKEWNIISNIVGFDEGRSSDMFIVIDGNGFGCKNGNVRESEFATSYCETKSDRHIWVSEDDIELVESFNNNNVLEIKTMNVFDDFVGIKITHQNYDIIKRGKFLDDELRIYSANFPSYTKTGTIYLNGILSEDDGQTIIVPKKDINDVLLRIEKLNNKYKSQFLEGGRYYTIEGDGSVIDFICYLNSDYFKKRKEINNVFLTKEEAMIAKNNILQVLDKNDRNADDDRNDRNDRNADDEISSEDIQEKDGILEIGSLKFKTEKCDTCNGCYFDEENLSVCSFLDDAGIIKDCEGKIYKLITNE